MTGLVWKQKSPAVCHKKWAETLSQGLTSVACKLNSMEMDSVFGSVFLTPSQEEMKNKTN